MNDYFKDDLSKEEDKDLLNRLSLEVIDIPSLYGATLKEARLHFDNIHRQTLVPPPLICEFEYEESAYQLHSNYIDEILNRPYLSHFIYVDDASVAGVLEARFHGPGEKFAWTTVVMTGVSYALTFHDQEEEDKEPGDDEDEESQEDYWGQYRGKFNLHDLVKVYAVICRGNWTDWWYSTQNGPATLVGI